MKAPERSHPSAWKLNVDLDESLDETPRGLVTSWNPVVLDGPSIWRIAAQLPFIIFPYACDEGPL
ncbi:MAG: hypothetical protein WCC94_09145 [Candidatus Bathyarchaeia archaeon]